MTTDLWILIAAVALQWTLIMVAATPRLLLNGIPWAVGNRHDDSVEVPRWADRAQRASNNLAENLPLFAIVVLVVHAVGAGNDTSALGAQIFLGGRLVHAAVFLAGVPVARTLSWAVSVGGIFVVASTLL